MATNRTPVSRFTRVQITPVAVDTYRRLRSWDGKCICPATAPYPGQIFNSADPEHRERARRYHEEHAAYEAACAKCEACPARAAAEAQLLRELRIELKPWHDGLDDFPDVLRALDAALAPGKAVP
jgi:hypothetical protein